MLTPPTFSCKPFILVGGGILWEDVCGRTNGGAAGQMGCGRTVGVGQDGWGGSMVVWMVVCMVVHMVAER